LDEDSITRSLVALDADCVEALIVAFYFLASLDLMVSRPLELRKFLRLASILVQSRGHDYEMSGTFLRVSTWFCFLDCRASAFGRGDASIIQTIGGETGLVQAMGNSNNFLREEYIMLYPKEEVERAKYHSPLLATILSLVAIFSDISRNYDNASDSLKSRIRLDLDEQKKVSAIIGTPWLSIHMLIRTECAGY
jgi:hypothetical protein